MTDIRPCDCKADSHGNPAAAKYQDEKYGSGMRVHNSRGPGRDKKSSDRWRCTVCGKG